MIEKVNKIYEEVKQSFSNASTIDEIEELRIKYLSRKGVVLSLFSMMKDADNSIKRELGQKLNTLKNDAFDFLNQRKKELEKSSKVKIDLSLPARKVNAGKVHPIQRVLKDVKNIFGKMGFSVASGPEIETEHYIFDALNMPEWHPARKVSDSLYVDKKAKTLLRTETSSVQIRTMESSNPPFRIISPGRVYRNEKENATHTAMFTQCEGLFIDKNVSFSDLKGTLLQFFKALYGKDTKVRFRPHFFPFTEPSAEVDVTCFKCTGKGCSLCKQSGWIELGGAGMVNPVVLEGVGVDPEEYSGFAFGLGIERITMLRYGISDIRDLYENNLKFLEQF
ncbi:MAG: phenylalanine--tRNA ligase subunit alpha [Candidatus Cloacimonadota bacterium]|nr:MAG: phenylalanine--tRNA ligase subunit alpha [Candidatus Cloacimonadota bacterium]PIE78697.1 MAG: phenylalanine--tRNA ligase subunit alpha [Candidatus Delongbacteria bacterium]